MSLTIDADLLRRVPLAQLHSWLHGAGWSAVDGPVAGPRVFRKVWGAEPVELEVPRSSALRDFPRRLAEVFEVLQQVEGRPASEIVTEVFTADADTISLSLRGPATRAGRLGLARGPETMQAARDLLLAVACAAGTPRAVFANRKPTQALAFLERARLAPSVAGSYVLRIEVPIDPPAQELLPGVEDPDPPFGRRVTALVPSALGALASAVDEAAGGDVVPAFRRRAAAGVSANLCEAVVQLLEGAGAEEVVVSTAFATWRPAPSGTPRAATVRAEMGPVLRAAARGLRAEAVFPGVEVRGPVVKLSSEQVGAGGDVTVHAEADGRMRYLVVALGPDEYRVAVAAHGEGKLVEVVGDLSRDGRGWRLTSPRAFAAVALETADSE